MTRWAAVTMSMDMVWIRHRTMLIVTHKEPKRSRNVILDCCRYALMQISPGGQILYRLSLWSRGIIIDSWAVDWLRLVQTKCFWVPLVVERIVGVDFSLDGGLDVEWSCREYSWQAHFFCDAWGTTAGRGSWVGRAVAPSGRLNLCGIVTGT